MKNTLFMIVVVFMFSISASADVLATVDSQELTWENLLELVGGPDVIANLGITSEDAAEEILESWIREQLILVAAEESNIALRPEVAAVIKQTVDQIILEAFLTDILDEVEVSRLEVENYIDVWSETYEYEYNVRHILLPDQAIASSVLSRLNTGESFSTLASQFSVGPSGPAGGELGWMARGMASPLFMEVVSRLSIGEISEIVKTTMGYHIIQLMDKKPITTSLTAEQINELVTMELVSARQEELLVEMIEQLEGEHIVNMWPERLLNHI